MVDRIKFEETIIKAYENVIKNLNKDGENKAAMMKKKDLWELVANEPGPSIGTFYSNWMIGYIIRKHLKNKRK